jgi:predicted SAM-dependent methyltransferase
MADVLDPDAVLALGPELRKRLRARDYPNPDQFSPQEIVVLSAFLEGAKDRARLIEDEYPDAFSHGWLNTDQITATLDQLRVKGLVVAGPPADETVTGFRERESRELHATLQSIARITSRIAGDVAGLSSDASCAFSNAPSIEERLDQIRGTLVAISEQLDEMRASHVRRQLDALHLDDRACHLRINIGSGSMRLPSPWINVDFAAGADLTMNILWGLPFADGSADYIYGAHVLEHIDYKAGARKLLADFSRVLSSRGKVRLVVPNIEGFMTAYVNANAAFFEERCKYNPFLSAFLSSRLEHVLDYAGAGTRTRPGEFFEHKFGYDFELLESMLKEAGFTRITRSGWMESDDPALRVDDKATFSSMTFAGIPNSLFVEAAN